MDTLWRIELLGGLRAVHEDQVVSRFGRRKNGQLLAYLAFHRRRSLPRDELVEIFWPESDPAAGHRDLRRALWSLRRQLEPPTVPPGAVLLSRHSALQLNPELCTSDVAQFEAALRAADHAAGDLEKIQRLTEAGERYRGELLPGSLASWVLPERQRLAEAFQLGVEQLIDLLQKQGNLPRALEWARRAVAADRLREEGHHMLIRLLAAAGQPTEALRQYEELECLMRQELGDAPGREIRALVREIERRTCGRDIQQAIQTTKSPRAPELGVSLPPLPLPIGTVTFLLTEIEEELALEEHAGDAYPIALVSYRALLQRLAQEQGGYLVTPEVGPEATARVSFLMAFRRAGDALAAAVAGQQALAAQSWPDAVGVPQTRMALHIGNAELHEGCYRGQALDRATRILPVGHGGQILCSEETAVLLRRDLEPDVRFTDLGTYRLWDGTAPERLFQVDYPGMTPREFPPLKAPRGGVSHLPRQFTRFFGRQQEIQRLCDLLLPPGGRMVTLTGPGGSGKTRLAVEVAARLAEPFHGAVWFVPLLDLTDPRLIIDQVREALHLPRLPNWEPLEQVVDALSRQPSLLLLDNFEQLLVDGAQTVQTLRERVATLTLLVTSRQRLSLPGERQFPVWPLPTPREPGAPEQLSRNESVQLFVDRAQAVRPDFQITHRNGAAVAELCRRLEGIPLALELAAARAQVLTPAQMLAHLDQRFKLLIARQTDGDRRHGSLWETLDWSYQLLPPDLQRFFARLSIFRGGWTSAAAGAVCEVADESRVQRYLEQLRECSLVLAEEVPDEMRFRMLETLREYASERLTPEEHVEAADRHLGYYLVLAELAQERMTNNEQLPWLERLDHEHENLRIALAWSVDTNQIEHGLRLVTALLRFWTARGHLHEVRRQMGELLKLPDNTNHPLVRANALHAAGWLAAEQRDYGATRAYFRESLAIFESRNDGVGTAVLLRDLASFDIDDKNWSVARARLRKSLRLCAALGVDWGTANALQSLARLHGLQGKHDEARKFIAEALSLRRKLNDPSRLAWTSVESARLERDAGELSTARRLFEESLRLFQDNGYKPGILACLEGLAEILTAEAASQRAARLLGAAAALRQELGQPPIESEPIECGDTALATAWAEGRALTLEQAIAHALNCSTTDRQAPVNG